MSSSQPQPANDLPVVLTIGGSDPSGGAGIQADLKTIHQLGVFGASAITLLTVQNTRGVSRVFFLPEDLIGEQVGVVCEDLDPDVIKVGALGNAATVRAVAAAMADLPPRKRPRLVVVDPVMISKHGHALVDQAAIEALQQLILPTATIVTPNRHEAERLSRAAISTTSDAMTAAQHMLSMGPRYVVLKTRLEQAAVDLLVSSDSEHEFSAPYIEAAGNHGSGCVLSAAIAAGLAMRGRSDLTELQMGAAVGIGKDSSFPSMEQMVEIVGEAKRFVTRGLKSGVRIGQGIHPVDILSSEKFGEL
ncbi:bifunctional hydroxymethylpyrimidine kinase/phosphomethylpyrimidine kinase [Planctomycetaceae bacterium SH139]